VHVQFQNIPSHEQRKVGRNRFRRGALFRPQAETWRFLNGGAQLANKLTAAEARCEAEQK
jgi:hypothetical protein